MSTATEVRIMCPEWCRVSATEHRDDLEAWRGSVMHYGEVEGHYVLQAMVQPDGSVAEGDSGLTVTLDGHDEGLSVSEALRVIRDLSEALEALTDLRLTERND